MSTAKSSVLSLLLAVATAHAPQRAPAPGAAVPQLEVQHPSTQTVAIEPPPADDVLPFLPYRRSADQFSNWSGPWAFGAGSYDHFYTTW